MDTLLQMYDYTGVCVFFMYFLGNVGPFGCSRDFGGCIRSFLGGGQLTGGQLTGGQLTGGQLTGGQLTGGQLTGGQLTAFPLEGYLSAIRP